MKEREGSVGRRLHIANFIAAKMPVTYAGFITRRGYGIALLGPVTAHGDPAIARPGIIPADPI
jgi:hypothetical protein